MTNNIVTVNVTQTVAPTPSTLQKTGALISQGATTLDIGTYGLVTEMADLEALLVAPSALASLTWAGEGFAEMVLAHGYPIGQTVTLVLAGNTPSGYNGTVACYITGPKTFRYTIASDPGPLTVAGTATKTGGANSTLTWAAGVVTVTTAAPSGLPTGSVIPITIAGVTPSGYNGVGRVCTATGASTFTFPLVSDPGAETVPGTWAPVALTVDTIEWHGLVTATAVNPHGYPVGLVIDLTIAGATPAGYNGVYSSTITGASTFVYVNDINPGTETVPGTYNPSAVVNELLAMVTTFFVQGSQQAIYVLELGAVSDATAIATLSSFITETTPQFFYIYVVPASWADAVQFHTFIAGFENLTAKTYFFVTVTASNYTNFDDTQKCLFNLIQAPAAPTAEFSVAAPAHVALNYDPSEANRVTPFAFSYLFGVTRYPTFQNAAFLNTLKAANVNWVGVGAEGGISNAVLFWGRIKDGRPFNYWYSVDWVQINGQLDLANAVINGSNNPANPLYYNQNGINRLQATLVRLMNRGIAFGLVLGDVVQTALTATDFQKAVDAGTFAGKTIVNAVPFIPYSRSNPGDYKIGKYGGLYVAYVPLRGFEQIIFNINVSDFVST